MRLFRREEVGASVDLLVAGLGNPGPEHARDRHNVGWMVVDELARRHQGSFKGKFRGRLADARVGSAKLALLKPETYMNESGASIQAAAAFYKLAPGAGARRPRRRRPRDRAPAGAPRRGARGPQRPPLDRAAARVAGVPPACGSASADPAVAIRGPSPTTCSRVSRPRTTRRRSSARAADAVECLVARGPRGDAAPLQLSAARPHAGRGLEREVGTSVAPTRLRRFGTKPTPIRHAFVASLTSGHLGCPWGHVEQRAAARPRRPDTMAARGRSRPSPWTS